MEILIQSAWDWALEIHGSETSNLGVTACLSSPSHFVLPITEAICPTLFGGTFMHAETSRSLDSGLQVVERAENPQGDSVV